MKIKFSSMALGLFALRFFTLPIFGQTVGTQSIVFTDNQAIPLSNFGSVRLGYPSCGPDGTSYFTTMVDPGTSRQTRLVSVSPEGKVTLFDYTAIPGLKSRVDVRSFSADGGSVIALAGGVADPSSAFSKSGQFLLEYSLSGSFVGVYGLPRDFTVVRIAAYKDNLLLALGLQEGSSVPQLRILGKKGITVGSIQVTEPILSKDDVKAYLASNSYQGMDELSEHEQMQYALSSVQMVKVGKDVVVFNPNSPSVWHVTQTGEVVYLALKKPVGLQLHTLADLGTGLTAVGFGLNTRSPNMLRYDSSTGEMSGELSVVGISATSAICSKSGTYYGVKMSKLGATLVMGHLQ